MKIYFKSIGTALCSLAIVAGLQSCNKQLNITQEGTPSAVGFWTKESDADAGVNSMYEYFDDENFYGRGFWWFINACDDMVTGRVKAEGDNIKNFNATFIGGGYTETQWSMRYKTIKRANEVINNVPGIAMSDAKKSRMLGEAYFLSGLMYFQLAANYGNAQSGVPIANRANPSDLEVIPCAANVNENYHYLINDLKKAAALLPYFDSYTTDMYGRAHKTAAWAFIAKSYLYMKQYDSAAMYCDSVILSGKHQLLTNFEEVFTTANNWSKEYIWSAYSTPSGKNGWGSILPGVMMENKGWGKYNGWGYYMPTQELYNEYESGDKRREATILKPGDTLQFFGETITYKSDNSLSGYQFNKYSEPFRYANPVGVYLSPNGDHPTTSLCLPLLRYAEIILIKAEAKIMMGQNADAELNMLRKRAWKSADENGYPKVSGATMVNLKHERRVELAGEWADRHRDLVRWGDAKEAYAKPLHGYSGKEVWPARSFDPATQGIWPIPQTAIDNSEGVIKQRSGW
ncbi:Starch-binding associating with outer membrane [Filimonas lacunae]|uniref:Starch-binding associating with outer membrane n=1 Tax=Filimonas lacunae TaxID=477680 RepID=A0A173MK47_9BACT|nr:RagB/SusD family nutrient uptake outer membrane protein [Filimonas lacunae]BAV07781.1 outer membrane protein, nutrient binding [Filimonas lacunae]SIT04685.1 Starch-binding associating with outer membrane [Filimonas lacunae]